MLYFPSYIESKGLKIEMNKISPGNNCHLFLMLENILKISDCMTTGLLYCLFEGSLCCGLWK